MRYQMRPLLFALALVHPSFLTETGLASIVNGDFQTPGISPDAFDGWTTFSAGVFFDRPTAGSDANGRFAILTDTGPLGSSQLEQTYDLPANAVSLSFDFVLEAIGVPLPGSVPDGFQATQFDIVFSPILPSGDPLLQPAYYSIDNLGSELFNPAVSFVTSALDLRAGWKRVVLDVTAVAPQSGVTLEFLLSKSFIEDGVVTTVSLDNVVLTTRDGVVVPEASSFCVFSLLALVGWSVGRWLQMSPAVGDNRIAVAELGRNFDELTRGNSQSARSPTYQNPSG